MEVLISDQVISVNWYIALFCIALVVAIISKSMLANVTFIMVCALGIFFAFRLDGASDTIQLSFVAVFLAFIGFSLQQLLTRVENL